MARTIALLGLLTALLGACGSTVSTPPSASAPLSSPSTLPSASASTAPPASASIEPSASASAATAAACPRASVKVTASEWGGAAGSRGTDITVANTGSSTCVLPASPRVVMIGPGGVVLESRPGPAGSGPTLAAGSSIAFSIVFSNWCDETNQLPLRFTLLLAGGSAPIDGATLTSADQLPPCNGAGQPAGLSTTQWEPG